MRRPRLVLGLVSAALALRIGAALAAGATIGQPAAPSPIGPPVRLVPLPRAAMTLPAAPSVGSPPAPTTAGAGAVPVAATAPMGLPSAEALAPRSRVPGTDGGDIVIEAIPASTHPATAGPSAAA